MTSRIEGVSNRVRALQDPFRKWLELMNMDHDGASWGAGDAPWWYNERASLSQFAGAIWQSGGWCFEEYRVRKRHLEGRIDEGWGRCDLALEVAGLKAIAEAKAIWPSSLDPESLHDAVRASLADAATQVDGYKAPDGYGRLALCFVAPVLAASPTDADISMAVEQLPESSAWSFPASSRRLESELNGQKYPGAILVVRPC